MNKVITIGLALVIGIATGYYWGRGVSENGEYWKTQYDVAMKLYYENLPTQTTEELIDSCIDNSYYEYKRRWNLFCEEIGEESDCVLQRRYGDPLSEQLDIDKDFCLKRYK